MTTSKSHDPNAIRDPRVDAAWRAASREESPAALDAAILAAARREVGAGPRSAREAETMRAQRWWWPLAVAATLGAITVGLLQTVTPDRVGAPASDSAVVTDMPTPVAKPGLETAGPAVKPAPEAATPMPANAQGPASTPSPIATPNSVTAPGGGNTTSDGRAAPRANSAQRTATVARTPPRPDAQRSPEAPAAATAEQKLESAPRGSAALPEPFPAAPQPRVASAAEATSTPAPAAVPGAQRFQEGAAARPAPLAKMAAEGAADGRVEEAHVKDRPPLPVAEWIALIRRLRAEGNSTDAAKELAAFRVAHVDHERLLPPDLRDWRPPEK